jgi:site-specific recombinase XerD
MVPLTEDWVKMRAFITPNVMEDKIAASAIDSAMELLHDLLVVRYNKPSITQLCHEEVTPVLASEVAKQVSEVVSSRVWKRGTARNNVGYVRKILGKTNVHPSLIKAFRLLPEKPAWNRLLGKIHGRLPPTDETRVRLEEWVEILKLNTNMNSDLSLRNTMIFYTGTVVPMLQLSIRDLCVPEDFSLSDEQVYSLCGDGVGIAKKTRWLNIFFEFILKTKFLISAPLVNKLKKKAKRTTAEAKEYDEHRISKTDLESIYKEASKNVFDTLWFMTMLTTGMRVGGFVKIKIKDIAHFDGEKYIVKDQAVTLEKSKKNFTFLVHKEVKHLVGVWLAQLRPPNPSPYLFPGGDNDHISTATIRFRFNRICAALQIEGKEYHPHALRHCFSHILLELGNSAETVSKLIAHSSVAITQKYYLKESAAQVAQRSNIPWMHENPVSENPVPDFLQPTKKRRKKVDAQKLLHLQLFNQ